MREKVDNIYITDEVKPFNKIIKVVNDIQRLDVSKLDDIPKWFDNLLHQY